MDKINLFDITTQCTPEQVAKMLDNLYDAVVNYEVAVLIKSQIPMYVGELNPKWKFWDDVCKLTNTKNSDEDSIRAYLINHLKKIKEV